MGLGDAIQFTTDTITFPRTVKLSNGNLFITYCYPNPVTYHGFFTILEQDGTVVVAETAFSTAIHGANHEIHATIMGNDNVMIVYCNGADGCLKVYNSSGTEIVAETSFFVSTDAKNLHVLPLDNGNTFITFKDGDAATNHAYYAIRTNAGVQVVVATQFCSLYGHYWKQTALCSDNDIAIAYSDNSDGVNSYLSMRVYDEDGVSQLGVTHIRAVGLVGEINTVGLANGNILVTYDDYSNGKFQIRQQDGTSVVAETTFSTGRTSNMSLVLLGTKTLISFLDGTSTGSCKYVIINQDGSIHTEETEFIASAYYTDTCYLNSLQTLITYDDGGSYITYTLEIEFNTSVVKKKLLAMANDTVFYEDSAGSMIEVAAATGTLDTLKDVSAFEGYQKAFIANETTFKVLDFGNVKVSTSDIVGGGIVPIKGTLLTGGTSNAQMLVDFVTASTSAAFVYGRRITTATFVDTETLTDSAATISFVLDADEVLPDPPHIYNWTPFANDTTTYGSMPDRATIACLYRGRGVVAGNPDAPHQWYMTRQADLWDWVYTALDSQSAVAGGNSDAGEIGDIITALIPYKDDYLIFGCADSVWALRGDPAAGGSLSEVSLTTGMFSSTSWCWDNNDNLYFLGSGGIYKMPPPFGLIENITSTVLPNLMNDLALDNTLHKITMLYDREKHGILVCKTTLSDGTNTNYWIDLRTGGFFPETYPTDDGPYSLFYYESVTPAHKDLLVGCKDGYIRIFDAAKKSDDGSTSDTAINSYIVFGPHLIAQDVGKYGLLKSLAVTVANDTDDILYKIFVADKAEKVADKVDASPQEASITGTISVFMRPTKIVQRAKGTYFALQIGNSTLDESWGMETIIGNLQEAGVR